MPATAVTKMSVVAAQKGPYLVFARVAGEAGAGELTPDNGLMRDCTTGGAHRSPAWPGWGGYQSPLSTCEFTLFPYATVTWSAWAKKGTKGAFPLRWQDAQSAAACTQEASIQGAGSCYGNVRLYPC